MAPTRKRPRSPVASPRQARPIRAAVARAAVLPTLATLLALGCRQPAPAVGAEPAPTPKTAASAAGTASAPSVGGVASLAPSASASAVVSSAPPCASSAKPATVASGEPSELPGLVGLPPNPNVNVAGGQGVVNPSVYGTSTAAPPPTSPPTRKMTVSVADGSAVPDADRVIAKSSWRFRACALKAAQLDPASGGTVRAVVKVDADGNVAGVTATGGSPATLTTCIGNSFHSLVFAAPDRADASVVVTVVITKGS